MKLTVKEQEQVKLLVSQAAEDKYFSEYNYAAVIRNAEGIISLISDRADIQNNTVLIETNDFKYEWRLAELDDDFWIRLGLMPPKPNKNWNFDKILGLEISIPEIVTKVVKNCYTEIKGQDQIEIGNCEYRFETNGGAYTLEMIDENNYTFSHTRKAGYLKVVVYGKDVTRKLYETNSGTRLNIHGMEHGIVDFDSYTKKSSYYPKNFEGNSWKGLVPNHSVGSDYEVVSNRLYGKCNELTLYFSMKDKCLSYMTYAGTQTLDDKYFLGKFLTKESKLVNIILTDQDNALGYTTEQGDIFIEVTENSEICKHYDKNLQYVGEVNIEDVEDRTFYLDIDREHPILKN